MSPAPPWSSTAAPPPEASWHNSYPGDDSQPGGRTSLRANDEGVGSWLPRRGALSPGKPALILEGMEWPYCEFSRRANAIAHALRSLGVCHGDRVAYLDLNHPNYFVTMFAAAKVGAIFVPLNFRLTAPELVFIINDAGVHTLVHDKAFGPLIQPIRADLC